MALLNDLSKPPTIHEAFVNVVTEIRQKNPKTSLREAYVEAKEPFTDKHGIAYNYSENTFLNHFYSKK